MSRRLFGRAGGKRGCKESRASAACAARGRETVGGLTGRVVSACDASMYQCVNAWQGGTWRLPRAARLPGLSSPGVHPGQAGVLASGRAARCIRGARPPWRQPRLPSAQPRRLLNDWPHSFLLFQSSFTAPPIPGPAGQPTKGRGPPSPAGKAALRQRMCTLKARGAARSRAGTRAVSLAQWPVGAPPPDHAAATTPAAVPARCCLCTAAGCLPAWRAGPHAGC